MRLPIILLIFSYMVHSIINPITHYSFIAFITSHHLYFNGLSIFMNFLSLLLPIIFSFVNFILHSFFHIFFIFLKTPLYVFSILNAIPINVCHLLKLCNPRNNIFSIRLCSNA